MRRRGSKHSARHLKAGYQLGVCWAEDFNCPHTLGAVIRLEVRPFLDKLIMSALFAFKTGLQPFGSVSGNCGCATALGHVEFRNTIGDGNDQVSCQG